MKTLILILIFTFSLFAQHDWSEPVQLSEVGIPGEVLYYDPITACTGDTLNTSWIKALKHPDQYLYATQIEVRQSYNGGIYWQDTENITPEYTEYSHDRIFQLKAVCDSYNNLYVFYMKGLGFDTNSVIFKKYNGLEWSEADTLTSLASKDLQVTVDKVDRIYVFWTRNGYQYYTYSDKSVTRVWLEPMMFENTELNTTITNSNFVFDEDNNLYITGNLTGDFKGLRPGLFSYNKSEEKWKDIEEIGSFTATSSGCALVLLSDSTLVTNVSVGQYIDEGYNYIVSRKLDTPTWSQPVYLNQNTNIYSKRMFTDSVDNIHLIERYIIDSKSELISCYTKGNIWNTDTIQADDVYSYNYFGAVNCNDKLHLCFSRSDHYDPNYNTTSIFFQTKLIDTGIEYDPQTIPKLPVLFQNYPNPFNSSTQIIYSIPQSGEVKLSVFNSKGELVKDLINSKQNKGHHSVMFEANDLNSGIYYYRIEVDGIVKESKKMLYLK
ncbi:MAG: T9SS type A sorting domain-containing protein [Candidatus Delongbacteria bacterium]|nr:T9SS type A sorting domain-containing protein [Candidatus Delongbacteria bacterium]MDD4205552.1 T9SS type A sorting domain-containing protein [Candidatus Delongbacteria bacterium]